MIYSLLRQTVASFTSNITTAPSIVPPVSIRDDDEEGQIWEELDKPSNALTDSDADSLLFMSTLDGSLNAVNKGTGKIVWTLKEVRILRFC